MTRIHAGMFLIACLQLGCGLYQPCVPGVEDGKVYRVSVHERYDSSSATLFDPAIVQLEAPSCTCVDGISGNATLNVWAQNHVATTGDGGCDILSGSVSELPGARLLASPYRRPSATNVIMGGSAFWFFPLDWVTVETGSGKGDWFGDLALSDRAAKGDLFAAPAAGAVPPLLLTRFFVPEGATLGCADTFVVSLHEIPFSTPRSEPTLGPATCGVAP